MSLELFTLSKVISIMCEIGSCCETSPKAQHSSNSGWYTRTLRPWIVYDPVGRNGDKGMSYILADLNNTWDAE